MITIRIPALWRAAVGAAQIEIQAGDVRAALQALVERFPCLREQLFDPQGQPRPSLHLFVNRETIRFRGGMAAALCEGDELYIVPMISGG
jgi:molybdopterin converting factor small subunit